MSVWVITPALWCGEPPSSKDPFRAPDLYGVVTAALRIAFFADGQA
jgi:hypothetical protein